MRVSVCLACYNGEKYISQQLLSILDQLSDDDEIVVSDNGSTDNTLDIIDMIKDPRIRVLKMPVRGVVGNFENALVNAKGDLIFLSDQDDIWLPGRLEEGMRLHKKYDVASVGLEFIDQNGEKLDRPKFIPSGGFVKTLLWNKYPGCSLSMTRDFLQRCLPFPTSIPMHDWWVVLLSMCIGIIGQSNKICIQYRRHDNNVSSTGSKSSANLIKKIIWRFCLIYELARRVCVLKKMRG